MKKKKKEFNGEKELKSKFHVWEKLVFRIFQGQIMIISVWVESCFFFSV